MASDNEDIDYKALQARRRIADQARDTAAKNGDLFACIDDFILDLFPVLPENVENKAETGKSSSHLTPNRHPTGDFFIADILDAAPKDDLASMEHPIFALRSGDTRVRTYERNGVTITISPTAAGCATIHDKDLWIYCISQLMAAKNLGRQISPTVRFTMYDFLVTTNRSTNGGKKGGYKLAEQMLARLKGTTIETNIETDGKRERGFFGLIDSARVIERDDDDRMVAVEVDLPRWLFRAVEASQVLAVSRDYFRLRKPLDRRIYELARKHCGRQKKWVINVKALFEKSGSASTLRLFKHNVKKLADANELPDYQVEIDSAHDLVLFKPR